jgi:hypothetical protein
MATKEYYIKNKEKVKKASKEWRLAHPEKFDEYRKKWVKNNRDKAKKASRNWQIKNPEKTKEIRRKWFAKHPTYWRDRHKQNPYRRFKKYGVDIFEIAKKQKNRCAICGEEKTLCVDHCHKKNVIRGLLCRTCNAGLGDFYDSVKNLKNAIKYLTFRKK